MTFYLMKDNKHSITYICPDENSKTYFMNNQEWKKADHEIQKKI